MPGNNVETKVDSQDMRCPSTSDEGSCEVPSLLHNALISEAILSPTLGIEESSDLITELDSHANMVDLGSKSFVFNW